MGRDTGARCRYQMDLPSQLSNQEESASIILLDGGDT